VTGIIFLYVELEKVTTTLNLPGLLTSGALWRQERDNAPHFKSRFGVKNPNTGTNECNRAQQNYSIKEQSQ
jgi:hypothetical protein